MIERLMLVVCAAAGLGLGCAGTPAPDPQAWSSLPASEATVTGAPPAASLAASARFAQEADRIDLGITRRDEIEARLGSPARLIGRDGGGSLRQYIWREDTRPKTEDAEARSSFGARLREGLRRGGRWLEDLIAYPPRQPRPVGSGPGAATVGVLEVEYDGEGRVTRYEAIFEPSYTGP